MSGEAVPRLEEPAVHDLMDGVLGVLKQRDIVIEDSDLRSLFYTEKGELVDFDDALGNTYGYLLDMGEDPDDFLAEAGILELGE